MSRVTDILDKARRVLGDKSKTRWTDADLLSLFNEGLSHFVLNAKTLKRRSYMLIENNIGIYDVSPYSSSIQRVQYLSQVLEGKLSSVMDKVDPTWEDTIGSVPQAVIFDVYGSNVFRLYPKVSAGSANIITQNSFFGGLIDIGVTDDLINVPAVEDLEQDISKYVVVFYIGIPRTLTIDSLDTDIDLHITYDAAMACYIAGQCLIFDQDSLSRELGNAQLGIYNSYLAKAMTKQSNSNNTVTDYTTEYRTF